jgi:hypothetical protein
MSTKTPLNAPAEECEVQCAADKSKFWCLWDRAVCAMRNSIFDPLCETEDIPIYRLDELRELLTDALALLPAGYSEALLDYPTTSHRLRDWLDLYEKHVKMDLSPLRGIAKGRLTIANKIGMALGASCRCCSGYRIIFAAVVGVVVGSIFL